MTDKELVKIGDKVTLINDYGVEFPGKTIIGKEIWTHGVNPKEVRYFIEPTDCPWYSSPGKNFRKED